MSSALLAALINQVLIPEILEIVRRRQLAGLTITDADIIKERNERALAIIAEGEAWLAAHQT